MPSVTRRTVLAAPVILAATAALAGCSDPAPPVAVDPDRERLAAALVIESGLLDDVAAWTGSSVLRDQLVAVFTTHVERLRQTLADPAGGASTTSSPSAQPSESAPPVTTVQLTQRVGRAVVAHSRALREADPPTAQLLASLAASDTAVSAALGGQS